MRISKIAFLIGFCLFAKLQAVFSQEIINTIAGTGVKGYSGDGGPAINCQFNRPSAFCFDKSGNIYITDAFNHAIRQISNTGKISTIAGTGIPGFSGNGGLAINAQFFVPQGICEDTTGNLYISDGKNNVIRKIDGTSTIITTIAGKGTPGYSGDGGLAINAELNAPVGLCVNYSGDIFITDYDNYVIRKIDAISGIITTIAGSGLSGYSGDGGPALAATFNSVIDVTIDHDNNILIADQYNGAVRKIDGVTGIITTIAGTGVLGYSGDGGPATSATLNEPANVFVDKIGNIYIADYRNGAIRKIDGSTGIINTIVGGVAGYGGDGGPPLSAKLKCTDVWVDDYGHIFIADYVNHRIREVFDPATVNVTAIANGELIIYPNPSPAKFIIELEKSQEYDLVVFNLVGQAVFHSKINSTTEIDLSKEPAGVYFIQVQSEGKKWVEKLVFTK